MPLCKKLRAHTESLATNIVYLPYWTIKKSSDLVKVAFDNSIILPECDSRSEDQNTPAKISSLASCPHPFVLIFTKVTAVSSISLLKSLDLLFLVSLGELLSQ